MQDRTRMLTSQLPALIAEVARHKDWSEGLHAAATAGAPGQVFVVDDATFRQTIPVASPSRDIASGLRAELLSHSRRGSRGSGRSTAW
jgi:hypothetical protein